MNVIGRTSSMTRESTYTMDGLLVQVQFNTLKRLERKCQIARLMFPR